MTTETAVSDVMERAMTSLTTGHRLGDDPDQEAVRAEVERLRRSGHSEAEIRTTIETFMSTSDGHGSNHLEALDAVLADAAR